MRGCAAADLGGGAHSFVVVVGRHAHVDDGEIGLVLGDDDEQRVGVADPRNDLVAGVLEQAREPLAQEDSVLGDHDPHGISASSRVPAPRRAVDQERPALRLDPVGQAGEPGAAAQRSRRRCRRRRPPAVRAPFDDGRFDANARRRSRA